jgi:hypothetical protein
MDEANAFAPAFMLDYNARFGRPPLKDHDAHRPFCPESGSTISSCSATSDG